MRKGPSQGAWQRRGEKYREVFLDRGHESDKERCESRGIKGPGSRRERKACRAWVGVGKPLSLRGWGRGEQWVRVGASPERKLEGPPG